MAQQQFWRSWCVRWLNACFRGDFVTEDDDKSQEDQQERLPLVVGSWLENPLQGPKGLRSMEMVQGLEINGGYGQLSSQGLRECRYNPQG